MERSQDIAKGTVRKGGKSTQHRKLSRQRREGINKDISSKMSNAINSNGRNTSPAASRDVIAHSVLQGAEGDSSNSNSSPGEALWWPSLNLRY